MITSRAALRVYGEYEFQVPPMTSPDLQYLLLARTDLATLLTQYEAVQLFIERAQAVQPNFAMDNQNAPAVAEICARLEGLPLAIELAAARIKHLSPEDVLAQLVDVYGQSSLRLLDPDEQTAELPATETRQQRTLRSTIDWSYNLLDENEKLLFARLAVFMGGATVEAVDAVCNPNLDLPIDTLDGLESLLDKSMLRLVEHAAGEPRFTMLEIMREYVLERLAASDTQLASSLQENHARYYLGLAEKAELKLRGGAQQAKWLNRLEAEHNNLRAALSWLIERKKAEQALQLSGALWRFWYWHNHLSEGCRWLETAIALARQTAEVPLAAWAKALEAAGNLFSVQGEYQQAITFFEECLALRQMIGDKAEIARTLNALGIAVYDQCNLARATALFKASLDLQRQLGDKLGIAHALNSLGCVLSNKGDYALAHELLNEALGLFRELQVDWGTVYALVNLGRAELYLGNHQLARPPLEEGIALCLRLGNHDVLAEYLDAFAAMIGSQGQPGLAAKLLGAAEALRETIGATIPPVERPIYERLIALACGTLDNATLKSAWTKGRTMTPEQAVSCALESAP
jgi:non-specific serine/threonine protein kinase